MTIQNLRAVALWTALCLIPSCAVAQQTPTQIQSSINSYIYPNADLLGANLNTIMNNMNVSYVPITGLGTGVYTALGQPINTPGNANSIPTFSSFGSGVASSLALATNASGGILLGPSSNCNTTGYALQYTIGATPTCSNINASAGTVTGVTSGAGLYIASSSPAPVIQLADRHTDGRLTLTSGTPVMTSTVSAQTTLYYAPYIGNLIAIYNGTNLQNYQFTSSASDTVGLSLALGSNWPANTVYDVFAWLNGGSPALCTVAWTSTTARATALATYNGILTNSGTPTCRYSNSATTTLAANQGTYLGSFYTNGSTGQVDYNFGGSSSGGTAASLAVWNYYNRVNVQAQVKDSGTSYTYQSNVIRQARASAGNQVVFINGVVEDAIVANYTSGINTTGNSGAYTNFGIGLNTTTSFTGVSSNCVASTNASQGCQTSAATTLLPTLGQQIVSANEQGDNSHSNTLDLSSTNTLVVMLRQ